MDNLVFGKGKHFMVKLEHDYIVSLSRDEHHALIENQATKSTCTYNTIKGHQAKYLSVKAFFVNQDWDGFVKALIQRKHID